VTTAASSRKPHRRTAPLRVRPGDASPRTTPEAILDAALEVFARDGFEGATMPAIARAAALGHPLIHYHFGSKDELWRAVADYAFGDFERIALEIDASSDDPVRKLTLVCRAFAAFTAQHPLHTLLVLNEIRAAGPRLDWLVEHHLAPLHARFDRVIGEAAQSGRIRRVPAAHLASIFVGAVTHFFGGAPLVERLYGVDARDPLVAAAHVEAVLAVLLDGILVDAKENP
jgi:TetR/AcrR family transcriptional regulator